MNLEIDRDRLSSEIEELATISDAEPPAVTRIVFTPTDLKARAWLRARCENAGLMVRQDAIGNTFARWAGSDPGAPARDAHPLQRVQLGVLADAPGPAEVQEPRV